ncbi:MAG: STAS domain-containing protein [Alkalispirochaeta sp.]
MTEVLVEPQEDRVDISVGGDVTISGVHELHRHVRAALTFELPVTVHLDQVRTFDLVGLQLLIAVQREGASRGTPVEFTGDATLERVRRMRAFAGLPEG